jgi:hypothetical protein
MPYKEGQLLLAYFAIQQGQFRIPAKLQGPMACLSARFDGA